LSLTRTFSGISLKMTLMLAGSVIALPGAASGTGATWPAATAGQPASRTHLASLARAAQPSGSVSPVRVIRTVPGSHGIGTVALAATAAPRHRTPRQIARSLLHRFRWRRWQFRYLNLLWATESGWDRYASNPCSGAYGIPQALPGRKMATAGPDWQSDARTQILWGMRYVNGHYRTPYRAWLQESLYGWY
jgi:hypothetical protein